MQYADSLLLQQSESTIPSLTTAEAMRTRTLGLDVQELENVRYYSLGLIACNFARIIQKEDVRSEAVDSIGHRLSNAWRRGSQNPHGLTISNLRSAAAFTSLFGPFLAIAQTARDQLSPAARLAADSLDVASRQQDSYVSLGVGEDEDAYKYDIDDIIAGEAAARALGKDAISGVTLVVSTILLARQSHATGQTLAEVKDADPAIADILTGEEFSSLQLGKYAALSAGLRNDELRTHLSEYLTVDQARQPIFLRERVPEQAALPEVPTIVDGTVTLHRAREKCPALYVTGLIPYMVGIMRDGILDAQKRLGQPF